MVHGSQGASAAACAQHGPTLQRDGGISAQTQAGVNMSNSARWVGFFSSSFVAQITQGWTTPLIKGSDGHVSKIILRTAWLSPTFPENPHKRHIKQRQIFAQRKPRIKTRLMETTLSWFGAEACRSFPSEHRTQQQLSPGAQQPPLSPTRGGGMFQTKQVSSTQPTAIPSSRQLRHGYS